MICVHNINISFSGEKIIRDLSFDAKEGEKICLYGPSGGGKTTVLNALMGFTDLETGSIKINGQELIPANISTIRQQITWLPQNINLPVKNGEELVKFYLQKKICNTVFEFMSMFGLEKEMFYKNINELSGGQKQRLILSACLSLERKILLLDEPTSALDEESVEKIIQVIFGLKGITLVSTSHNPLWINKCDKTINIKPE